MLHLRVEAAVSEDAQANNMVHQLNMEVAQDVRLSNMAPQPHRLNMELHLEDRPMVDRLMVDLLTEVLLRSNTELHQPHRSNMVLHQLRPSNMVPHPMEALLLSNTVPQAAEVDIAVEDTKLVPRLETVFHKLRLAATHQMVADTLPMVDTAPAVQDRPSQPRSPSHTPRAEATTTKH